MLAPHVYTYYAYFGSTSQLVHCIINIIFTCGEKDSRKLVTRAFLTFPHYHLPVRNHFTLTEICTLTKVLDVCLEKMQPRILQRICMQTLNICMHSTNTQM